MIYDLFTQYYIDLFTPYYIYYISLSLQYALPYLRKTKGNIVNIASISGVIANAASPTYCASKVSKLSFKQSFHSWKETNFIEHSGAS
jgi:short-subunit dehydrogenase